MNPQATHPFKPQLIPLSEARQGQRIRVSQVDGGQGLRARLCAMGLTQGCTAEVMSCCDGPVILSVMGSRLVVGSGMACKIQVKTLPALASN